MEQILAGTLHSVGAMHILLCAQYSALDLRVWRHVPLPTVLFKKARQKEIASIKPCKPGSAANCHFFGTKDSILS